MKAQDFINLKFGNLTVIDGIGKSEPFSFWKCKCDCGKITQVPTHRLRSGNTKSCGCLRISAIIKTGHKNTIHGLEKTAVYRSWIAMIRRCYSQKEPAYSSYGGRGIIACEFLRTSPCNLKSLLGDRPDNLSLDRIENNSGSYTCGSCAECLSNGWTLNVRWATRKVQNRNTRANVKITIKGVTKCAPEWSELSGIPALAILWRFHKRWPEDRLLTKGKTGICNR